jgi:hypothetical protein
MIKTHSWLLETADLFGALFGGSSKYQKIPLWSLKLWISMLDVRWYVPSLAVQWSSWHRACDLWNY